MGITNKILPDFRKRRFYFTLELTYNARQTVASEVGEQLTNGHQHLPIKVSLIPVSNKIEC
jgi:hypothetical protein